MTIIVFLLDTSASMNQKSYLGTSFLDLAKSAIEAFLKIRARDPGSRGMDRYMLVTLEEWPLCVKAGWKESQATFQAELRGLRATGKSELGLGLGSAFQLLNLNRLQSGIDNYGQGRYPYFLEPAVIVTLTDGDRLSPSPDCPEPQLISVPRPSSLGSELTLEPFRWDQRVFALVLRFPGHPPRAGALGQLAALDPGPLQPMCEATGGRSYALRSHKDLAPALENLAARIHSGIIVHLEKTGPDPPPAVPSTSGANGPVNGLHPAQNGGEDSNGGSNGAEGKEEDFVPSLKRENTASLMTKVEEMTEEREAATDRSWESVRCMLFVPRLLHKGYQGYHWPLPEAYFPTVQNAALPARAAHPRLRFTCTPCDQAALQDFPLDRYELEPSPLTHALLSRRQPGLAWQVFVDGSGRDVGNIVGTGPALGAPFGYLKPSKDLRSVSLVLLPYNYPALFPLLHTLRTKLGGKVSSSWRLRFDAYLKQIPPYYYEPLRKAFARLSLPNLMPDRSQDLVFSYAVNQYLVRVKQKAKEEYERLLAAIAARAAIMAVSAPLPGTRRHAGVALLRDKTAASQTIQRLVDAQEAGLSAAQIREMQDDGLANVKLILRQPPASTLVPKAASAFRNPFDIPRHRLLAQIRTMRLSLKEELGGGGGVCKLPGGLPNRRLATAVHLHQLPVAAMGNYQDYLARLPPPLRPVTDQPVRAHAFGNPFKMDKNLKNVDEINIDGMGSPAGGSSPVRSPKKGDLARRPSGIKRKGLPKGYKYKRRRLDPASGEVLSDSGVETDSSYDSDASTSTAGTSSSPPSPCLPSAPSPSPVSFAPQASSTLPSHSSASAEPGPSEPPPPETAKAKEARLFKDKARSRVSRDERSSSKPRGSAKRPREGREGLSSEDLAAVKRQMGEVVRKPGPLGRKERRLRELWEWGVETAKDRRALLNFAVQEAGRFKERALLKSLQAALKENS